MIDTVNSDLANKANTSALTDGSVTKVGTSTVGSGTKPIYLSSGTPTASSSTVGSGTKPIYLSSGTVTASSSTVGSAYRPVYLNSGTLTQCTSTSFYTAGDSISSATINTAGYVTSSGTSVRFMVPLAKPLSGVSTITVTSCTLTLRQDGNYTHGSSSSATVTPSSVTAVSRFGGLQIDCTMSSTTNVINNDSIGVTATIGFSFS